jgi:hypothetical protein
MKPRTRGKALGRASYKDNDKVARMSIFVERNLDLKITLMASKKRIHKSELFNQLLKLGLQKQKEELVDGIDS